MVLIICLAGCAKKPDEPAPATADPENVISAPTETGMPEDPTPEPTAEPTPEPTAEPTAAPDPIQAQASALAAQHGLTEEDLRGEYGLFIEFSEAIEGNPELGEYDELVYLIFPVIADHTDYIDTDYLFGKLGQLRICESELDPGHAGEFWLSTNTIFLNPDRGESDDSQLPSIVFHELMHFIDFTVNDEETMLYLLDGKLLAAEEFLGLPLDDQIRAMIVYDAEPILEGCAEIYTAKYFAGAARSYFDTCAFITGLEHIYGTEKLDELFFSKNSAALFAQLFLEAGYTEDEYYNAAASLNWLVNPAGYHPADYKRPEDILIDLYEYKLGSGWQTDEEFLYVLKALNGIAWSGYEESEHADFLAGIEFDTWKKYEDFIAKVLADLPVDPDLRYLPPTPVIQNGRFTLAAFAEWTDPDTGELIHGTVAVEYDFAAEKPLGYELADMDVMLNKYFG